MSEATVTRSTDFIGDAVSTQATLRPSADLASQAVALETQHLSRSVVERVLVDDISMQVQRGEVLAIVGPSGAGKSSFLRLLNRLDEPTRGIDVGAKAEIYRLMRALAEKGTVILMISSDMEEILNVSDRVAVMHEGEISGALERADCTEENIMQLAVGKRIAVAKQAFAP